MFSIIETQALHRDRVDWLGVRQRFDASVDTAATFGSALRAFRGVFEALDDVHSAIYYDGGGIGYRPSHSTPPARDVSALIQLSRERAGEPSGQMLSGEVAFVEVPAYGPRSQGEIDAESGELRDLVCDLAGENPTGWIVDLRLNEGGNVYVMLSGLGDLLGDGVMVRSVDARGEPVLDWSLREGVLYLDEFQTTTVERRCPEARTAGPVAVLVGPATLSSAQITAIAFAGWDQARLFGDPTGEGYATANQWFQIRPGLALNLSVAYFADRNGTVYEGTVYPDEQVPGEWRLDAPEQDPVVRRALEWLAEAEGDEP